MRHSASRWAWGSRPFGLTLAAACSLGLLAALLDSRSKGGDPSDEDYKAVYKAVKEGRVEAFRSLIGRVDPNRRFMDRETLLMRAANDGNVEMMRLLLRNGARVDLYDRWGITALGLAGGDRAACGYLLGVGADPNGVEGGTPPLTLAADLRRTDIVRLLIQAGACVDGRDHDGDTALMKSALRNDRATAKFLLAHGANPHIRNRKGEAAESLARGVEMQGLLQGEAKRFRRRMAWAIKPHNI